MQLVKYLTVVSLNVSCSLLPLVVNNCSLQLFVQMTLTLQSPLAGMFSYLFEDLVPVVLIIALIVLEFLLILCCYRGNRNNTGRKVEEIIKYHGRART